MITYIWRTSLLRWLLLQCNYVHFFDHLLVHFFGHSYSHILDISSLIQWDFNNLSEKITTINYFYIDIWKLNITKLILEVFRSFLGFLRLRPPLVAPPPRHSPYFVAGPYHTLRDLPLSLFSLAGIMLCLGDPLCSGTEARGVSFLGQQGFFDGLPPEPSHNLLAGMFYVRIFCRYTKREGSLARF